jgi:endonuclease YncB( thermonuclease family)
VKAVRLGLLVALALAVAFFGRGRFDERRHADSAAPFPADVSGRAAPIDGDSLWVGNHEVRLKGIDAPEGRQTCRRNGEVWRCGDAARAALSDMIGGETVFCAVSERDRYGRLLARCRARDRDLNAGMVGAGMAVAYGGYEREEAAAKAARRGVWDSDFQMPRQWREKNNAAQRR